ncbi:MAG: DNA polymerase III subunit delta [Clostridiales Family XIII bacterium]|nr:DNA polymerase III subunit delta [Clostridiales Family XIII bacterium]
MSYKQLNADLKSGEINSPKPILLYGTEAYLVDFYANKLIETFGVSPEMSFDFVSLRGDETDDQAIMAAIDTFPMMSPLKVIVVHDYQGLTDSNKDAPLLTYIEQMPDYARLIFATTKVKKDKMTGETQSEVKKNTAAYKRLAKYGRVYEFGKLSEKELQNFVAKRLKETGVGITAELLAAFIGESGYLDKSSEKDLLTVMNEAYKLGTYAHDAGRNRIVSQDLTDCMGITLRKDTFQMLDYISTGQKGKAIELLEQSFSMGESAFGVIALLTGQFEIMLAYKEMSEKGYPIGKMTSILNQKSDWRLKKLGGFSGNWTKIQLMEALHKLYNIEKEIRLGNVSEKLGLTVLVSQI